MTIPNQLREHALYHGSAFLGLLPQAALYRLIVVCDEIWLKTFSEIERRMFLYLVALYLESEKP